MAENNQRCRYWPRCTIHRGDPAPRLLDPADRAQIRAMHRAGHTAVDIAVMFDCHPQTVRRLCRPPRPGAPGRLGRVGRPRKKRRRRTPPA